ncbi:MAG: hypothetical protein IKC48_03835 [Clostridia bacterium]|nr:hypothetical protein [Clostridia bacterium]
MKKDAFKKIAVIVGNVLLYVFIAICLFGVILTVTAKKDADGTATIFGRQLRIVKTASMEASEGTDVSDFDIKSIRTGAMIFVQVVPEYDATAWYDSLNEGDVLTFKYVYGKQETITHRITKKTPKEGGFVFELTGDNKDGEMGALTQTIDTTLADSPNYIIGKVVGQSYVLGKFVSALQSPAGLVLIVIIPALAIIAFEVIRIVGVIGPSKKKQSEIEELRKRVAELEAKEIEQTGDAAN